MHAEIQIIQGELIHLYEHWRALLGGKPRAEVEELLHRSEELIHAPDFSVRTAAEICRAACVMVLGLDQPKGGKR